MDDRDLQRCTDVELIAMVERRSGAMRELYRRHVDAVLAFLVRRGLDVETAADLTAETFAAALVAAPRFRPGPVPVRGWLFAIADHKRVDLVRRDRSSTDARRRLGLGDVRVQPDDIADLEERLDCTAIGRAAMGRIDDLPPAERDAVLAHIVRDEELADLARRLDITVPTLRRRIQRGLRRLRRPDPKDQPA